ncbi:MAG: hypothetical protein ABI862_13005, partial [Ilumatobacteraceae bacterium]
MNSHHQQPAERAPRVAAAHHRHGGKRRSPAVYLAMVIGMLSALVLVQSSSPSPVQAATSTLLTLNVVSGRTETQALGGAPRLLPGGGVGVVKGDAIADFKYIINVDNTGTTEQNP